MPAADSTDGGADSLRVVIAHDFAEAYGGAERVMAIAADIYPDAPFWAILGRPAVAERMGVSDRFHTVLPARRVFLERYRKMAPLFPALTRLRRLPEADVLLTSSYAFAHAFSTANRAPQVCYCHGPLRFAWTMTADYGRLVSSGRVGGVAFRAVAGAMRWADRRAAAKVTRYVASSRFVAEKIKRFYGRDAEVVHPPVDCDLFRPADQPGHDGYFLFCSRLVEPSKRPTLAVEAFRSLPERLVVAGDGPALPRLKEIAPGNVEFIGALEQSRLRSLMQRCAAVIFPSIDDFGLVPLEAMACGRPVIAYAEGGALETVVPGVTGERFSEQTSESLRAAVRRFDPDAYDPASLRSHAEGFGIAPFREALSRIVAETAAGGADPA